MRAPDAAKNECVFGYDGDDETCDDLCGLVGGTCSGRLDGGKLCDGDQATSQVCTRLRNDGACYCEFPDEQVQQEGPTVETLLDQNKVADPDERERELTAVKNQCTENETNALQGALGFNKSCFQN